MNKFFKIDNHQWLNFKKFEPRVYNLMCIKPLAIFLGGCSLGLHYFPLIKPASLFLDNLYFAQEMKGNFAVGWLQPSALDTKFRFVFVYFYST